MNILGLRCSNKDYSLSVVCGSKGSPILVKTCSVAYPKGYAKPQGLKWFLQEIEDLLKKHSISAIVMKGFEGRSRGTTFVERIEHEAIVFLSGANLGIKRIHRKVKSTIAKDMGMKGKGHYLETQLDKSAIPTFSQLPDKEQEATLAAWSELP
jgi:hypothetical protein